MTVNTESSKISYAGNGSAIQFAVPFKFLGNGHIRAVLRDASGAETVWTEGGDYSLAGAGVEGGGTLTATVAPAIGEVLLIKRVVPEAQAVDLPLGGALSSATVEEMVDRLTMMVQQHSEEIARAILFKETSAAAGVVLPEPEADKLLGWNAAADNLENKEMASGGSGPTEHGALTGLADDDHTQYLLASGARAMAGALDMGANAIANVGTVDGRDLSADGAKLDGIEPGSQANDVNSVHGRTGVVTAAAGDYDADQIAFAPAGGIAATDVQAAIAELDAEKAAPGEVAAVDTKTGNYTLALGDKGKAVRMNLAGANSLTVPANASAAFPTGSVVHVLQSGAGQTSIAEDTGVTVRTPATLNLRAQHSMATLLKIGTDEWVVSGDLETA